MNLELFFPLSFSFPLGVPYHVFVSMIQPHIYCTKTFGISCLLLILWLVSACYMAIVFISLFSSNFSQPCKGQWTGTCGMRSLQLRYSPWQGSPAVLATMQDVPLGAPMRPMLAIEDVPPEVPDAAQQEGEDDESGKWHLAGHGEPADWGFENVYWF